MVKKRKAKNQGGAGDMDIGDAAVTSAVTSTAGAAKDVVAAGFPYASATEGGAAASGQEAGGPIASGNAMGFRPSPPPPLPFPTNPSPPFPSHVSTLAPHALPLPLPPGTPPCSLFPPCAPPVTQARQPTATKVTPLHLRAPLYILPFPPPLPLPTPPLSPLPPVPPFPSTSPLQPSPPASPTLPSGTNTSETMGFTVIKESADAARSIPALPGMRKKGAPERRAKTRKKQKLLDKALAI
ncbi:unnamed protein product [Closterium sp. Naga37s-1]|nr:unnamed protein product [Closterium sp. Naga37s-1]